MASFKLRAVGGADRFDEGECRKSLALIWPLDEWREIRALPSGRCQTLKGDPDEAIKAIADFADESVYWCINPIQPRAKHANKSTVLRRDWLIVDIDPVRLKGVSASDAEKQSASLVASRVVSDLSGRGWPAPILIDSGNGYHLYYRIDLPNDALAQSTAKKALVTLAERHDMPEAVIDRSVHDAPRIAKIPGTYARKGPDTADRPHRLCRLLSVPSAVEPVPWDLLSSLGDKKASAPTSKTTYQKTATDGPGVEAYARRALENEIGRLTLTGESRNAALYEASLKLAGLVKAGALDEEDTRRALASAASLIGLGTDGDPEEIKRAIDNAFSVATPRDLSGIGTKQFKQKSQEPIPSQNLIIWASSIQPRHVEWLWPARIPLGKMTTFAGKGKIGKTFVLCDVAARISRGMEWPFSNGECADIGNTLFISGEDDEDDTLVPRLIELGADLNRIAFLSPKSQEQFTLAALELLGRVITEMGQETRLVVIDPPASYLDGVDDHKNAELRGLLTPIKNWCKDRRVSVIFNSHVNKATGAGVDAASRVMASVAWVNAVRAAHMFIPDENERGQVKFCSLGTNVGPPPKGLVYRIVALDSHRARVEWLSEIDEDADQALNGTKGTKRSATEVLIEMFSNKQKWESDEFWKELKRWGVSRETYDDVKYKLNIPRAKRETTPYGEIVYSYHVPPDWPFLVKNQPKTEKPEF